MRETQAARPNQERKEQSLGVDSMVHDDNDPSFMRNNISLGEVRYLGQDFMLPVPNNIDPEFFGKIVLDYLGTPETLDESEQVPMLDSGPLSGYRFGYVEFGGDLSRAARVFALAEQIKTGAFDESEDVDMGYREEELIKYLEFNRTRIEDVVVLDQDSRIVAMCRAAFGDLNSSWDDFEIGHLYDLAGEDPSRAPIDALAFSALEENIRLKGIGLGSIMDVPAIITAEEYQNTIMGVQLLLALDAFVFHSTYDVEASTTKQHSLIMGSTQESLTAALIGIFGFRTLGPTTPWGATPIWVDADALVELYVGDMKMATEHYIRHLCNQQNKP